MNKKFVRILKEEIKKMQKKKKGKIKKKKEDTYLPSKHLCGHISH